MAFFKSSEEREQEAREQAEAERRQAVLQRGQQEADRRAAEAAALAASPEGRARAARRRGDRWFRLQLEVAWLTGGSSAFGSSDNRLDALPDGQDVLGRVQDEGWRLQHVDHVFIETGSTSTARMLNTGEGTVTRGVVLGVHLFRRADDPA